MIKRYCDCCGVEITASNVVNGDHSQLTGEVRKQGGHALLSVKVITAKNHTWNDGDFCKYCIIDAFIQADDRLNPYI